MKYSDDDMIAFLKDHAAPYRVLDHATIIKVPRGSPLLDEKSVHFFNNSQQPCYIVTEENGKRYCVMQQSLRTPWGGHPDYNLFYPDDVVEASASYIRFLDNPSEDVQLMAVMRDGETIQYIPNPSEAVKYAAIEEFPNAIRFLTNPSYELQRLAIQISPFTIRHIQEPSEELIKLAIDLEPYVTQYLPNISPKMLQYAKTGILYD